MGYMWITPSERKAWVAMTNRTIAEHKRFYSSPLPESMKPKDNSVLLRTDLTHKEAYGYD